MSACGGDDGSGSGSSGSSSGSALSDALGSVAAGPASEQRFSWSDVAAIRKVANLPSSVAQLKGGDATSKWLLPLGTGGDRLLPFSRVLEEQLKLDYLSVERAITVGLPPRVAVRLDGVDAAPVGDALRKLGARETSSGDRTILARGAERSIDIGAQLGGALVGIGNRAVAEDGTVALSGTDASLLEVLGDGGDPLGDQPEYEAAADCLGDVLSADLYSGAFVRTPDAAIVSFGVRGDAREVLCAVGDKAQVERMTSALTKHFDPDAITPSTRQPLKDLVTSAKVDSGEASGKSYARAVLTLPQDSQAGLLSKLAQRDGLAIYLGG